MKKLSCLLAGILLMLFWLTPALAASKEPIDLSPLRGSTLYSMDMDEEGYAFISTQIRVEHFEHEHALEDHPSSIYSDIIVLDYYKDPYPCWRLWINYRAERFLGITSVTIDVDDTRFTFTGLGGKDNMRSTGSYVEECIPIQMGSENLLFWSMLLLKYENEEDKATCLDWSFPAVLHGTEDIPITISGWAMTDFWLVGEAMLQINGFDALLDNEGATCTNQDLAPNVSSTSL